MEKIYLNENYPVEKRNILNEMRSTGITLQELRFISIYLSKINPREIEVTRAVCFQLKDFEKIMELKRLQVKDTKPAIDNLLQKIIHLPDKRGGYLAFQFFKQCKVSQDDRGIWFVEIDIHDESISLISDFKDNYFRYQLWNSLRLKSSNQLRMYEILKQYEGIGQRVCLLENLKELLGIEETEYPRWVRFKECVLDVCQKALEKYTDIVYTYETMKTGNKVTAVKFNISRNPKYVDELKLGKFIDKAVLASPSASTSRISVPKAGKGTSKTKAHEFLKEMKSSNLYPYALKLAKKKKAEGEVNGRTDNYACGIVNNWMEYGMQTVQDLLNADIIDAA